MFLGTLLGPVILSEIYWPNSAYGLRLEGPPSLPGFVPGILKDSMILCIPFPHQAFTKDQLGVWDEELIRLPRSGFGVPAVMPGVQP